MSQECGKSKTSLPILSQSFQSIWMECGLLLRLVGVMNLVLVLSGHSVFEGENPAYKILFKQNLTLTCTQTFDTIFFQTWQDDKDN